MSTMYEQLQAMIEAAHKVVFFGGAGASTESGIPDFRSVDGLYNTRYKYPPEEILSHHFFLNDTQEFYRFYRDKMLYKDAKPNAAHMALAALEKSGKLTAVITQNIDGLHQKAGSQNVLELHGSVWRNYCTSCGKLFTLDEILNMSLVPHCECGGVIKPDVVLYEESLDSGVMTKSVQALTQADLLIVGGTSLNVYPAAGLLQYFSGKLVVINKTPTFADAKADLVLQQAIGTVLC
ncbi:MAG: NAD-dependent protein deacylase [Oscillospiraceae bacterium]